MIAEEDADIDAELPGIENMYMYMYMWRWWDVVLPRKRVWMNIIILTPQILRLA